MNDDARLERIFSDALAESAPSRAPDRLRADIKHAVGQTRPRPRWLATLREAPMHTLTTAVVGPSTARRSTQLPARLAWLMLIALLALALAAGGAIVGSRMLFGGTAAIPQGGAAVFAYASRGDIFTIRADGTDARQLTSGPAIEGGPSWSPDGTRIAYRAWMDGTDSVEIMDGDGQNASVLATTSQPTSDCLGTDWGWGGDPAWSPDGGSLIYPTSGTCDDRYDLFIVATDGSSPATRLLVPGLNASAAAWSPDGTRIAMVAREATAHAGLYVADVAVGGALGGGIQAHRITDAAANVDWMQPRWSPDDDELAAAAGTNDDCIQYDSGSLDAFAVKADGSGQRSLASEAAKEYLPTWSPDGKRIAFQRLVDPAEWKNGRPCTTSTWVIDKDGTNEHRLEGFGPDPITPLWSPDGTRIAGAGPVGDTATLGLYFVTVDGSSPLVVVEANDDIGSGSWQPFAVPFPEAPLFGGSESP